MFAPKDRSTSISATGKRDERLGCIFVRRAERRCFGRPTLGQMVSALPSVLFMTPTSHRLRYRLGRGRSTDGSPSRTISRISQRGGRRNRYGSCGPRTDASPHFVRKNRSWEENSMFKSILIPTDGSDLAAKAVEQGVLFAKEIGAKITAVTVTEDRKST